MSVKAILTIHPIVRLVSSFHVSRWIPETPVTILLLLPTRSISFYDVLSLG
jgi:hypothetical protein